MLNVKNGTITIEGSDVHYNVFGKGTENLVLIPGLSDGLRTVKGLALMMAANYKHFSRRYRVWIFSRGMNLAESVTTRDMARELALAMDAVGIDKAKVMGLSQGGMIAQWLAIDFPEKVTKLAIIVSAARAHETLKTGITRWIKLCEDRRYGELSVDTMEKTYTEKKMKKLRPVMFLIKMLSKPKLPERFIKQAQAVLNHDAYNELGNIKCPCLVIGGGRDLVVGGREVQEELAGGIPESSLHVYPELGHAAFEEAEDFNNRVLDFFQN